MRQDKGVRRQFAAIMAVLLAVGCAAPARGSSPFRQRVVVQGLNNVFEILYGPDGLLWATEKTGRRVLRIEPATGRIVTAEPITAATGSPRGQDGLLGMALRLPDVYLAYSSVRGLTIARYAFDAATGRLRHRADLVTGLPTSTDHASGRLVLGPDDKLYYTIGDQGNGQFARACRPNNAQDPRILEGKVLRINRDGTAPADNPLPGYVYSYGHRNPQGLVFGNGRLYSSEQGPKTDDEVNWIRPGRNYGWPRVAGYADRKAYVWAEWARSKACTAFSDYAIPPSVPVHPETEPPGFAAPMRTFYTVADGYDFRDPKCAADLNMCWPTLAPSSLDYYGAAGIPGWRHSLLMPSLKGGAVYRMPLSANGTSVGTAVPELRTVNRYRDTAISPDGRSIFVATDRAGSTRDLAGRPTSRLANPGAILEFRYPASSSRVRGSSPS
jgi:PQQ-dependent dehydrogenase (s-GDH family)